MCLTPEEKFLLDFIQNHHITLLEIEKLKKRYAKKKTAGCFSNLKLLVAYRSLLKEKKIKPNHKLFELLKKQKVRTLSGIASIAVLTKPYPCPGKCLYCPDEKGMPKSYLSDEPAVMRAIRNDFDPAKQIITRLKALGLAGHKTNKIELIVMGGTFSALPKKYQTWFIRRCFEAANDPENARVRPIISVRTRRRGASVRQAQKINETAKNRIIGLTLETRPDFITPAEIRRFRILGATRVELGVQSINDEILKKNRRGHKVTATIRATKLLKDAGFKINYHLMPNLYGSTLAKDLKMFREIFTNPEFQPDLIKIYPCVVTRDSELEKLYREKKFKPYSNEKLIKLLVAIKKIVPPYVRIMRLGRDIPANDIRGGNKLSNIRQIVQERLKKENAACRCIRCREVKREIVDLTRLKLIRRDYLASSGKEVFLSFEDVKNNKLLALLRLRLPSKNSIFQVLKNSAIVREVHTYGEALSFSKQKDDAAQHLGLGKKLIVEAEKIAQEEFKVKKIAVIAGVGAREYYRKLGYKLRETYLVKRLK